MTCSFSAQSRHLGLLLVCTFGNLHGSKLALLVTSALPDNCDLSGKIIKHNSLNNKNKTSYLPCVLVLLTIGRANKVLIASQRDLLVPSSRTPRHLPRAVIRIWRAFPRIQLQEAVFAPIEYCVPCVELKRAILELPT